MLPPLFGPPPQVTVMHGLHLLEVRPALLEAHRILKPGGKLVVAFNDRCVCVRQRGRGGGRGEREQPVGRAYL